MSLIINGMSLPKHSAVNGEKDTAYRCVILAHSDNTVELVIDTEFASPYDNGHNVQRYPLTEIPTPHGRLIDADRLLALVEKEVNNTCIGCEPEPDDCCAYDRFKEIISEIKTAPTIIEAEVSERVK